MKVNFYWHRYKYLPYEQTLAARELSILLGQEPIYRNNGLSVESANGWKSHAQRMTYFREAVADDGSRVVPLQAVLEISTKNGGHSIFSDVDTTQEFPNGDVLPVQNHQILSRQSTRYSAHGLHEYRGKFNPQIVRAIGNMLGLQPGDWLLDPFGGSGTTLLEAIHMGWNAISVDINPLGVYIAQAKIAAMTVPIEELRSCVNVLSQRIGERFKNTPFDQAFTEDEIRSIGGKDWQDRLPGFEYLNAWFTRSVLTQLAAILDEISLIPSEKIRLILRVILSDILREVSLQDPRDLRIRRRKFPAENAPAVSCYLDSVKSKIETILRARQYISEITTVQDALLGDSRYCASTVRAHSKINNTLQFHAVITSPPYATALPYIDTQRLSLVFLGLVSPNELRAMEKCLTGNREITTQERLELEDAIEDNAAGLPSECVLLCRKLKESLDKEKDGFRRQNVPALLYQYLVDMSLMFKHTSPLLRTNAPFALVVGKNQTRLGEQTFVIDTPHLLAVLAKHNGFALQEMLELDTYQRFDVHQGNSIRSEALVVLKKVNNAS